MSPLSPLEPRLLLDGVEVKEPVKVTKSGKRRKRNRSHGIIKGGVGGEASEDGEGVKGSRERNRGTIQGGVGRETLENEMELTSCVIEKRST